MGKTWIIIWREYVTRVKNKTFIVMCFLAPALVGGTFFLTQELSKQIDPTRKIVIVDETVLPDSISYANAFHDTNNLVFNFNYLHVPQHDVNKIFKDSVHTSVLVIPANFNGADTSSMGVGHELILKSKVAAANGDVILLQNMISSDIQKDNLKK